MSKHNIADAKDHLPELIDRALGGEPVLITRDGQPVIELRPIQTLPRHVTKADLEWLSARRVSPKWPVENAGTLLSRMRDEDW